MLHGLVLFIYDFSGFIYSAATPYEFQKKCLGGCFVLYLLLCNTDFFLKPELTT